MIQLNLDDLNKTHRFLKYKAYLYMGDEQFRPLPLRDKHLICEDLRLYSIWCESSLLK